MIKFFKQRFTKKTKKETLEELNSLHIDFFNNIDGYSLDLQQRIVALNEDRSLLVVSGAGSGKTLTIIAKIKYLIEVKGIKPSEILCISFTNEATKSLKNKLCKYDVDIYTFHKLSLHILNKSNFTYKICSADFLEYVVDEFFCGIILENDYLIKCVLYYLNLKVNKNYEKIYLENLYNKKFKELRKLIVKFISLFKANSFNVIDFTKFIRRTLSIKEKLFLIITLNVYLVYKNELFSSRLIDFDDMIIKSTEIVNKKIVKLNYKYIIIDEYQDTSYVRYLLVKSIIDNSNANIIGVGDDFQSIYRFSGCDLNIFLNFNKFFPQSKILKIENTYRNSQELINICGKFIMRNKNQLKKNLLSKKHIINPIIICYCNNFCSNFELLINNIKGNIMILGRNNEDVLQILNENIELIDGEICYKKNDKINLTYLTVHKSKGLESDNVIVLNVVDDILGFPNKLSDDKVLRFVINSKNKILYEEERRLFYVALTRTKNKVYLLTKKNKKSIFIKELLKYHKQQIKIIEFEKQNKKSK